MIDIKKNCLKCLLLAVVWLAHSAYADDEQDAGKLPLPRFASLKADEVNMRMGPGTRYSINWVYKREGLPVEILQEYDQWREIRDSEGTTGWVHKQMLQGKRAAITRNGISILRRSPEAKARPVLRVEPGVIGRVLECEKSWCRLQISGRKGWIEKTRFWGVYPGEKF